MKAVLSNGRVYVVELSEPFEWTHKRPKANYVALTEKIDTPVLSRYKWGATLNDFRCFLPDLVFVDIPEEKLPEHIVNQLHSFGCK